jgi:formylmethanofuran dehydrogenase subunit B
MDLSKLEIKETGFLHIKDAEGELMYENDKPVGIELFSLGSKQFQKAKAKANKKSIERFKKKGKFEAANAEDALQDRAEFLTDCTSNIVGLEYGKLTGRELAMAIYSNTSVGFIAEQVDAYLGDWANFTKTSTTN